MINNIELCEVPNHENFRIDKNFNIYIMENDLIKNIIPYEDGKFKYNDKNYYSFNIAHLTFYGVDNKYYFKEYKIKSDNEIEINGIIFKHIPIDNINDYFISNNGAVFSLLRKIILKHKIDRDGYHRITLYPHNGFTNMPIHRLVYITWKGDIPEGFVIHHMNNLKWDNRIDNLEAITPSLNIRYAAEDGLFKRTFEWNSEIVHDVCKLMEENVSVPDIAKLYNIDFKDIKKYKNFRNQLYYFRLHQRSWVDITSQYNFKDYTGDIRPSSKYRSTDIRNMREMYKEGKSVDEIYKIYNKTSRDYLVAILKYRKCKKII